MASYARCLLFLVFATLSFFLQIHGRESKFFSKVTKTRKETNASYVSLAPALSPTVAPALSGEAKVVEHGYGLYGRDPYETTPTKTVMPTKNTIPGEEEKYVDVEQFSNNNVNVNGNGNEYEYEYSANRRNPVLGEDKFVSERQGMSDTRFLENGKYYYDVNQDVRKDVNEEEYVSKKQGMSDTRFMENGKYYYDVQNKDNHPLSNPNNHQNRQFQHENNGMSDTRFMENGKYLYDVQNQDNQPLSNPKNHENRQFQQENNGMSDTRYLNNGNYNYDGNAGNMNENNGRGGYNKFEEKSNYPNEYMAHERKGNYGGPKKFPNEYDTMEEYDREQGYIDPRDVYVP